MVLQRFPLVPRAYLALRRPLAARHAQQLVQARALGLLDEEAGVGQLLPRRLVLAAGAVDALGHLTLRLLPPPEALQRRGFQHERRDQLAVRVDRLRRVLQRAPPVGLPALATN